MLVTLVVYWVAEQYADLLGEHTHQGRLPKAAQIRASFSASFPMVSASFLPLLSLLAARLLGASALGAAEVALAVAVTLLIYHGYMAARTAGLAGVRLVAATGHGGFIGSGDGRLEGAPPASSPSLLASPDTPRRSLRGR